MPKPSNEMSSRAPAMGASNFSKLGGGMTPKGGITKKRSVGTRLGGKHLGTYFRKEISKVNPGKEPEMDIKGELCTGREGY